MDHQNVKTVIFYDSGLGGLNLIDRLGPASRHIKKIFLADNAVFPIGRLPEKDVRERCISKLKSVHSKYKADRIVIACNTAATACLADSQRMFSVPVHGVIPDLTDALAMSRSKTVALLATPSTIRRSFIKDFVRSIEPHSSIICVGTTDLVTLGQEKMLNGFVSDADITRALSPLSENPKAHLVDIVILACTHFWALRNEICRALKLEASALYDPAEKLAEELRQLLASTPNPVQGDEQRYESTLLLTGDHDRERLKRAFWLRGFRLGDRYER